MAMNPFVSVVITTFNQERFIEATVRSALAQTYPHREIIVVDDGSTDSTPSLLAAFGDQIVFIRQSNQGVAESRNSGVRRARGELLAFLDGDDLWAPDKLAVQVETYRQYPQAGLVVVDACMFSESGLLEPSTLRGAGEFIQGVQEETFCARSFEALLPDNFIVTTSQVMVPASVLARIGPSDPAFKIASDYDLYLRIAMHYEVAFAKRVLTHWRYTPTSVSGPAALRPFRCRLEGIGVLRKQLPDAPPEWRGLIRETLRSKSWITAREAYYFGWEQDRAFARRFLPELWRGNPRSPWPLLYWAAVLVPAWSQTLIKSLFRAVLPPSRRRFPRPGMSAT
jgi:glycosyltransferase involved in cell wall biosynthesis